jgi:hypothetical protein
MDVGFWHLQNASDFIRNGHALANLKRIEIRDFMASNAVKSYIDGAELISPQMKQIIENQKKLMPRNYQNSFYKRRNSYSYSGSNYSNQLDSQIAAQIAKSLMVPSNSFFQEGGEDSL